jgi:hypothetical protein
MIWVSARNHLDSLSRHARRYSYTGVLKPRGSPDIVIAGPIDGQASPYLRSHDHTTAKLIVGEHTGPLGRMP